MIGHAQLSHDLSPVDIIFHLIAVMLNYLGSIAITFVVNSVIHVTSDILREKQLSIDLSPTIIISWPASLIKPQCATYMVSIILRPSNNDIL